MSPGLTRAALWHLEGYTLQLSTKAASGYAGVVQKGRMWEAAVWFPKYVYLGTHAGPAEAALAVAKHHAKCRAKVAEGDDAEEEPEAVEEELKAEAAEPPPKRTKGLPLQVGCRMQVPDAIFGGQCGVESRAATVTALRHDEAELHFAADDQRYWFKSVEARQWLVTEVRQPPWRPRQSKIK